MCLHIFFFKYNFQDAAVLALMTNSLDCWIGLNDIASDGSMVWTEDGSSAAFTNWYGNNPATSTVQNCVKKKLTQEGKWDDVGCGKELDYACSMAATDSCA